MTGTVILKIIFMGTPDFAVPALEALAADGHDIAAVYTQPPRPKGRGRQVQRSPVHDAADRRGLIVHTPVSLKKDPRAQEEFAALKADIAVVAAYGLILPQAVLDAPVHGCLNIHASLLPRWRGASPIQHAIWAGDAESGITVMRMEAGLDTGPMLSKQAVAIDGGTTARALHDALSALGGTMIAETLRRLAAGVTLDGEPQDPALATYAPLLHKEDGRIGWEKPAALIGRQLRAFNPWPGVWTETEDGRRLKVLDAEAVQGSFTGEPGTVADKDGHVVCGGGALRLILVQPENAKPMDIAAAVNGRYILPGMRFV